MKDIKTKNWGEADIDLRHITHLFQAIPEEIHLKENGALDDGPSIAIVMNGHGRVWSVVGQVSIKMLSEALDELGYRLERK